MLSETRHRESHVVRRARVCEERERDVLKELERIGGAALLQHLGQRTLIAPHESENAITGRRK